MRTGKRLRERLAAFRKSLQHGGSVLDLGAPEYGQLDPFTTIEAVADELRSQIRRSAVDARRWKVLGVVLFVIDIILFLIGWLIL